jgi:hypothetical protein
MFAGSSKAQIARTSIIVGILAAIAFFVYQTGVLKSPAMHVRNESSVEVNVVVQGNPGSATSTVVLTVPPWTEETCPTGGWSMGPGSRPVHAYLAPQSQPTMTFPQGGPYYIRVDASGVMHLGEPVPTDPVGCKVYLVTLR